MLKTSWGVILNWQRDGIGDWKDSFHLHVLWSMNSPLGNFSHFRLRFTPSGLSEEGGVFNLSSINILCALAWEVSEMFQHWETLSQSGFSLIYFLPGGLPLVFSVSASCCKPEIRLLAGHVGDQTCSAASLTFAAPSLLWLSFASRPMLCRRKSHEGYHCNMESSSISNKKWMVSLPKTVELLGSHENFCRYMLLWTSD